MKCCITDDPRGKTEQEVQILPIKGDQQDGPKEVTLSSYVLIKKGPRRGAERRGELAPLR